MKTLIEIYHQLFPHTGIADWYFALMGLLVHVLMKAKHIPFHRFKWRIFIGEFIPVWFLCAVTLIILLGILPVVWKNYNLLDSALIGYSSSSIFKQLLKNRRFGNMNVFM
jgi:hypothetical protein